MPEYNIIIDKINYTAQNGFHTVQTAKLHGGGNGSKMSEGIYLSTWPIPKHVTMEAALSENQKVISQIQADVPAYHHRALRKKLISKFGRLSHKTSLANLREFYRVATGDQTASLTTAEEEIDARLREALEMKDPDLILDLRGQNKGHSDKFAVFWEKNESVSQRVICCA